MLTDEQLIANFVSNHMEITFAPGEYLGWLHLHTPDTHQARCLHPGCGWNERREGDAQSDTEEAAYEHATEHVFAATNPKEN